MKKSMKSYSEFYLSEILRVRDMSLVSFERQMGLPLNYLKDRAVLNLPETTALLRLLFHLPGLLDVCAEGFSVAAVEKFLAEALTEARLREVVE